MVTGERLTAAEFRRRLRALLLELEDTDEGQAVEAALAYVRRAGRRRRLRRPG